MFSWDWRWLSKEARWSIWGVTASRSTSVRGMKWNFIPSYLPQFVLFMFKLTRDSCGLWKVLKLKCWNVQAGKDLVPENRGGKVLEFWSGGPENFIFGDFLFRRFSASAKCREYGSLAASVKCQQKLRLWLLEGPLAFWPGALSLYSALVCSCCNAVTLKTDLVCVIFVLLKPSPWT